VIALISLVDTAEEAFVGKGLYLKRLLWGKDSI
jgi:hypothetical protein